MPQSSGVGPGDPGDIQCWQREWKAAETECRQSTGKEEEVPERAIKQLLVSRTPSHRLEGEDRST